MHRLGVAFGLFIVAAFATGTVLAATTYTPGPAVPTSPPLSQYTIYGVHGVFIGVGSTIPGLVGAQDGALAPNGVGPGNGNSIGLNGTAVISGDARSGQNTNLANNAHITGDLTRVRDCLTHPTPCSTLHLGSGASVGNDLQFDTVDFPALPAATDLFVAFGVSCPTSGPAESGNPVTLGPGTYGALTTGGGATINLTGAGDYFFDSVTTGNGTTWNLVAGVRVYVCGAMTLGAGNDVLPTGLLASDVSWEVQSSDTHNAFKCGGGCDWIGNVFAPNGGIHFGSGSGPTSEKGTFHALFVDIEHGVTSTKPPEESPPEKSGHKFNDLNGNGVWDDATEPGLNGWTINLYHDAPIPANLVTFAVTADDIFLSPGFYDFVLDPGTTYYVCEELLSSDWVQTMPNALTPDPDGPTNDVVTNTCPAPAIWGYKVTLENGVNETLNDFGNFEKAHKYGLKFNDLNGNGSNDAEPPIVNWPIYLLDGANVPVGPAVTPTNPVYTDALGAYSFEIAQAGTYKVCEGTIAGGWVQTYPNALSGDPNFPTDVKINTCPTPRVYGYQITVTSGATFRADDFGNTQALCQKQPVQAVLNPSTGYWPGNLGPDYIARVNNGDLVQDAVNNAALPTIPGVQGDKNGDGVIIIMVLAHDDNSLGGSSAQSVSIGADYRTTSASPLKFGLIGCSVTLTGGGAGAAISITSGASAANTPIADGATANSNIVVMDLHGGNSATGIAVTGNGRYLRNENATGNSGTGISISGNQNTIHNGNAIGNTGNGVSIVGTGNLATDTNAMSNGQNGFDVSGGSNKLLKLDLGEKGTPNGVDGLHLVGDSNTIQENKAYNNGDDGIDVTGNLNQLTKNIAGDKGKGNGFSTALASAGIRIQGNSNTLTQNTANANLGDGFNVTGNSAALKNTLKNNLSNTGSLENAGPEYRFLVNAIINGGGNKKDNVSFASTAVLAAGYE